jgi:hypothetical protein
MFVFGYQLDFQELFYREKRFYVGLIEGAGVMYSYTVNAKIMLSDERMILAGLKSRDARLGKTATAKIRRIENSTRNRLFFNEPVPSEIAMSDLSNSTKKHISKYTSKSRETLPLRLDLFELQVH